MPLISPFCSFIGREIKNSCSSGVPMLQLYLVVVLKTVLAKVHMVVPAALCMCKNMLVALPLRAATSAHCFDICSW